IMKHIVKLGKGTMEGYQKKVLHDVHVDKVAYQNLYADLKDKYSEWVEKWPEKTDPRKHVFEDVGIATWLILLWRQEPTTTKPFQFVDLGCGNGLLTFILISEGFRGWGVDLARRKLWDLFPMHIQAQLRERALDPPTEVFADANWLIGNHADELTPWIPIWALKSGAKFMVIPCCPHVLSGARYTRCDKNLGRYHTYCKYIAEQAERLGYPVAQENLRIPSTRNVCLFSKQVLDPSGPTHQAALLEMTANVQVQIRKSDREKTMARLAKQKPVRPHPPADAPAHIDSLM
ncbi:tRNA(Ser) Um(44) 2'-O-methyltransferase, partial [Kappamyces sp. JEL0680]